MGFTSKHIYYKIHEYFYVELRWISVTKLKYTASRIVSNSRWKRCNKISNVIEKVPEKNINSK